MISIEKIRELPEYRVVKKYFPLMFKLYLDEWNWWRTLLIGQFNFSYEFENWILTKYSESAGRGGMCVGVNDIWFGKQYFVLWPSTAQSPVKKSFTDFNKDSFCKHGHTLYPMGNYRVWDRFTIKFRAYNDIFEETQTPIIVINGYKLSKIYN